MSPPLFSPPSTTRTPAESPLMIRLRRGKLYASGLVPHRKLGNENPGVADFPRQFCVIGRVNTIDAAPEHRKGPSSLFKAGSWAMVSIPRASPLAMASPWPTSSPVSDRVTALP